MLVQKEKQFLEVITAPTSSVYLLLVEIHAADRNGKWCTVWFIAYCFCRTKTGFSSKFGTYVANGGGNARFNIYVYLGFKPAWIMVRKSSGANKFMDYIGDNKRLVNSYDPTK